MRISGLRLMVAAVAAAVTLSGPVSAQQTRITGAGASFPFPLYAAWTQAFSAATKGVQMDYQSTGSGAGVKAFIDRTVDFAASDAGINEEDQAKVKGGVVALPMTAGEIVLAYNLPGVTELRLPREVYPLIFTGQITKWNDERIVAANPGVKLPDQQITVVRRSDGSGTTFVFTKHLAAVDPAAEKTLGVGTNVQWPNQPNFVGAPRNDGVTATIMQTPGAIGYIEYGFAVLSKTPMAVLQNKVGEFVAPGGEAGKIALASADMTGDSLQVWVSDPAASGAYPIATFTWMLFYKDLGKPAIAKILQDFVAWAMKDGQAMSEELGYVPLPPAVIERVLAESKKIG